MVGLLLSLASLALALGVGDMARAVDCKECLDGDVPGVVCLEGPADGGGDWNGVAAPIDPQSLASKANLPRTPPSCFHSVELVLRRERPVKVLLSEMTVRCDSWLGLRLWFCVREAEGEGDSLGWEYDEEDRGGLVGVDGGRVEIDGMFAVRAGEAGRWVPEPLKGDAEVDSYGIAWSSSVLRRLSFFHGRIELRAELGDEAVEATVDDVEARGGGVCPLAGTDRRFVDGERLRIRVLATEPSAEVVDCEALSGGLRAPDAARKRFKRPIVMG